MRPEILVLGANSYIAQNAVAALEGRQLALSVRSSPNGLVQGREHPVIQADLTKSIQPLLAAKPRELWIFARPAEGDFEQNNDFYYHLKKLLYAYVRRLHLKRVVFISTQLVYASPQPDELLEAGSALGPQDLYDYTKADTELFLQTLQAGYELEAVDIYRVPLAFGGMITEAQKDAQLIYHWLQAYRDGAHWAEIPESQSHHGTCWLHVPDFASFLANERQDPSFRVRNCLTGSFRYTEIEQAGLRCWGRGEVDESLWRPRSAFFMKKEVPLPERRFDEALSKELAGWA